MSGPRPQNVKNKPPGHTFDTFLAQGIKMLKISLPRSLLTFAPRALTKCFKVALLGLLLVHFWPNASKTLENRPPGDTFGTCLAQGLQMLQIGLLGSLLVHVWPKASKCSK